METNHIASLRALAEQRGILIGAAANERALRTDYAYRETLAQEFNLLTTENELKLGSLCPRPGVYDFSPAEELVNFAHANDMQVRGHTLVWHEAAPNWLKESSYNRRQALDLLRKHIFTVMGHFRREIAFWDVVNEPISPTGGMRDSFWLHTIGPDYIEQAFNFAREADPQAKLFLNDYRVEGLNDKSTHLYEMTRDLLKRGVPIHGVGLQMHIALYESELFSPLPAVGNLLDNLKRFADLGLEIHITEMDVQMKNLTGTLEERLEKQAGVYEQVLHTALRNEQFKALILWGFTDRYSWIPKYTGYPDAPLPFNEYYQPKPAYNALYRALEMVEVKSFG